MKLLHLNHHMFNESSFELYKDNDFKISTFIYPSRIEGIKMENSRGYLTVLPFHGLIIWDAIFDNISLEAVQDL